MVFFSKFAWSSTILFIMPLLLFAQSEQNDDLDVIEAEVQKAEKKPAIIQSKTIEKQQTVERLTDLGKIVPFSEVSVLQKRWMPKTGRFQVYGGLSTMTNEPWFVTLGGNLRFGYGFVEAWGIEGVAAMFSSTANQSAKDLEGNNGVYTSTFVTPKSYLGLNLIWTPIYGKMTRSSNKITPFDFYFSFGGGQMTLDNSSKKSVQALQVGTGQIYAMSRSVGFRWDLSVFNYSAQSADGVGGSFNNIVLSMGLNMYFPDVGER